MPERNEQNTPGNASLGLGIASAALVFGIGICALVGAQQGWIARPPHGFFNPVSNLLCTSRRTRAASRALCSDRKRRTASSS